MKIEIHDIPDNATIKLARIIGDLDVLNADSLRKTIISQIEKGTPNWVFDLQNLRFIDSVGNLSLINIHIKARKANGGIVLYGVNQNVKEILDVVGISKIIPIFASFEQALHSFK